MITVADLRRLELFEGLTADQVRALLADGDEMEIVPGEVLFREGDPADDWWVLVDGSVDLVRRVGREDVVVAQMSVPGRWAGGMRAWDESGGYLATGRGRVPGRMLRVPSRALKDHAVAWFPVAVILLEGLYHTARNIESTVRQRESLVTLGTLSAGLAHELNNPAAAATRAAESLQRSTHTLLSSLRRLADEEISAQQFAVLDTLRQELGRPGAVPRDALDIADAEDALAGWLERHGVADAWSLAAPLAAAGADPAWCDRVDAALDGTGLEPALRWVASSFDTDALLGEVREATRRVSELVTAVKSFSQMDRGSRQRVDVTEGIESSLLVLGHKLKQGVEVVRDYDDVPLVDAYAGELNQVWANLVDNAVDAMDGHGTLRVSTRADGDAVVVEVADSGPGMPVDVAARAFEAFFTTKEVGKGTGLGLDIARRIVEERHGGTLTYERVGDETVLRVRLPLGA